LTTDLPKTLLPVNDDATILDCALANLRHAGVEHALVVVGFAADAIEARLPAMRRRHDIEVTTVFNEHALDRNNAYSLWLARDAFAQGAIVVNGDTVCPPSVTGTLVDAMRDHERAPTIDVALAVDDRKPLADEEMKIVHDGSGVVRRISKTIEPRDAHGEYIGVSLIAPPAAERVANALQTAWELDTTLYYEDGYQVVADEGGCVVAVPIGDVAWVEVDNADDLERARALPCLS
jgi:choline kinase